MARILVTAGPTREYLDDVRFLSNGSTGRMGFAIAEAACSAGHEATVVAGPTEVACESRVRRIDVVSADEMLAAAERCWAEADVVFGAAAVADHRPETRASGKPSKAASETVTLVRNPDIIAALAAARRPDQLVVGFALESLSIGGLEGAVERGRSKLNRKQLDLCVVNGTAAMAADRSYVVVVDAEGGRDDWPEDSKAMTAQRLLRRALAAWEQRCQNAQ